MKMAVLNTTIITADGDFSIRTVTTEEARELIQSTPFVSYVGHKATAEVMSQLFGMEVKHSRELFHHQPGQVALCLKLNGRIPEGTILTVSEMEKIGYVFKTIEMKDPDEVPAGIYNYINELNCQYGTLHPIAVIDAILDCVGIMLSLKAMEMLIDSLSNKENRDLALEYYARYIETGKRLKWEEYKEKRLEQ